MDAIRQSVWSYHESFGFNFVEEEKNKPNLDKNWNSKLVIRKYMGFGETTSGGIRKSPAYLVKTYRSLVEKVALIALWNREFDVFFRGQKNDHKDKNGKTVIYPSICRPMKRSDGSYCKSIRTLTIEQRYNELTSFRQYYTQKNKDMMNYFKNKGEDKYRNKYGSDYDVYDYSLFQHYEILPTPLIDITQSLRVAVSFALRYSTTGYLYVFGLPYPNGSISHYIDLGVVLVKLQSACPPDALRPRYQEGFMVGRLPFWPYKSAGDNLARRLIAKFYIDNTSGNFWDSLIKPIPSALTRTSRNQTGCDIMVMVTMINNARCHHHVVDRALSGQDSGRHLLL